MTSPIQALLPSGTFLQAIAIPLMMMSFTLSFTFSFSSILLNCARIASAASIFTSIVK